MFKANPQLPPLKCRKCRSYNIGCICSIQCCTYRESRHKLVKRAGSLNRGFTSPNVAVEIRGRKCAAGIPYYANYSANVHYRFPTNYCPFSSADFRRES